MMKHLFFWLARRSNRMAVNIPQGKKTYLLLYSETAVQKCCPSSFSWKLFEWKVYELGSLQ